MMMSIISMGIVSVPWMMFGFSLAFGSGGGALIGDFSYAGLAGLEQVVWPGTKVPALLFAVYQMTFAVISAAIISGAVIERMRFSAYAAFILFWSILVYVPLCHWVWGPGGWIEEMGSKDFAGGTVVHMSTAVSALALARLLGPRARHGSTEQEKDQPHNVPFVILGGALLWFGWSGFNGGCALAADYSAALALVNTYQSAAASLTVWSALERWQFKRYSAVGTVTGAVVGLVIITPAAGYVTPVGAAIMGAVGCALAYPTFQLSSSRVDDSLDCFPCHGVSGFIGTMLTGLFATEGGLLYGGGFALLQAQFVASIATAAYAAFMSAAIFLGLRLLMRMRVSEDDESMGLDNTLHGQRAYQEKSTPTGKQAEEAAKRGSADFGDLETAQVNISGVEEGL